MQIVTLIFTFSFDSVLDRPDMTFAVDWALKSIVYPLFALKVNYEKEKKNHTKIN